MSTIAGDLSGHRGGALGLLAAVVGVVATVAFGLAVPGLGLLLGAAIGLLAYRHDRWRRNGFVALGVAVTVVGFVFVWGVSMHSSPVRPEQSPVRVVPPTR
jgi:hypothetical protein